MEKTLTYSEDEFEIEKCPFCGASAVVKKVSAKNGSEYGRKVSCVRCGAGTRLYQSTEDCVESWNRRV